MFLGSDLFEPTLFTTSLYFVSCLIIFFIINIIIQIGKGIVEIKLKVIRFYFLSLIGLFSFFYYLIYPGFVSYDDLHTAGVVIQGQVWGWQSLSYSFLSGAELMMTRGFGLKTIVSLIYFLFLCSKFINLMSKETTKKSHQYIVMSLLFVLALNPLNQGMLLTHFRDVIFSLLLIHICFFIFDKSINWNHKNLIKFSILLVLLSDLRQDSKIYLLLIPLCFVYFKILNIKQTIKLVLLLTAFSFIYLFSLAKIYNFESNNNDYQVTAYIQPLSAIFYFVDENKIDDSDRAAIDAVIDTKMLKEFYSPSDIDPFHKGAYKGRHSAEQWNKFQATSFKLFAKHFDIFLKNRWLNFKSMLNFGLPNMTFYDHLRTEDTTKVSGILNKLGLNSKSNEPSTLGQFYIAGISYLGQQRDQGKWIYNSMFFPLIFLLLIFIYRKSDIRLKIVALIVAIRLPLLFLVAPASYFKYVYSIFLFFIFFFPLFLMDYLQNTPKKIDILKDKL